MRTCGVQMSVTFGIEFLTSNIMTMNCKKVSCEILLSLVLCHCSALMSSITNFDPHLCLKVTTWYVDVEISHFIFCRMQFYHPYCSKPWGMNNHYTLMFNATNPNWKINLFNNLLKNDLTLGPLETSSLLH